MTWVLLWFVLGVVALTLFAYLGRRLFLQAKALTKELATASERMSEISASLTERSASPTPNPPSRH